MNRCIHRCYYGSFDEALAGFVSYYILHNGFKAYKALPTSKQRLRLLMIKEGYFYEED